MTQGLAFLVKSVQVWQLQSEKRQISQPKHTQEVQPWHVGLRLQPLYTLRLARSSSSSQVILKYKNNRSHQYFNLKTNQNTRKQFCPPLPKKQQHSDSVNWVFAQVHVCKVSTYT